MIAGTVKKPIANVLSGVLPGPRNRNAVGTMIMPPRTTSQNSFVLEALSDDKTTSSSRRR